MIDHSHLKAVPRFALLSQPVRDWICEHSSLVQVQAGEPIFLEGDECNCLHIVLQGEVKIFKSLESGREIILNFFHPGEAFGEVALIDGGEFPANAIAPINSLLMRMSRDHYLELLRTFPEAALSIIRDLSLRMRTLRQRVELMGEAGVEARIAQLLISLGQQGGTPSDGDRLCVPFHLTRSEIADMVGARNETVIRIMSRWNKVGLVIKNDRGFEVENISGLTALLKNSGKDLD